MIFTLTDRNYNALDAYETDDYLIGQYIGSILETLEIEVSVKSLNAQHWIQGHYIMCTDKTGRNYWFTIYDVDDSLSSDYKKISCFSGTIDIVSEEFPPIKATSPQPFTWYMSQIFVDTGIVIGINEIADMKRTLEFEGTNHTNVEMLQFVLNGFDNADAQLEVEFDGVRPKKIVLNVYKHLGAIEPQELLTSEVDNLEELERKGSISELATGLRPTGEETDGKALTLKGKYFEEKDSDGNILYYSPKDRIEIFSVQGRQNFFVDLPNKSNGEFDGYIVRDYSSQAKTQEALWREALIKLKKIDHASVEYEAKGYITCDLGDNIQIVAHEMKPPVMISARVTEYKFNDDDSSRNEYKFNNFVELESNMSELDKIIADIKKDIDYVVDMKVDYAIGNDNVTVPLTWVEKEPNVPQGKYLWTRTSTYMSKGAVIPAYSITYVAIDGKPGVGVSSTKITYQAGISGTTTPTGTWSESIPTVSENQFLWTRTITTYSDNSSSTGYSVSKMGGKGAEGVGVSSSVVTYASSTSGVTPPSNWSTNIPTVVEGSYLWTRTVLTFSDNTTNTSYSVAKQGVTGPQGPPTGINTSATVPSNPYVNMLWQNTGTNNGYITGVTYQWNGAKWNIYIFTAENIAVTSLSAISSNIGMITAGVINGAVIISEFQRDLWEGSGIYKKGEIQITDGQMITTFDEIQRSTNTILAKGLIISDENGFSISRVTPAGQLLNGTTYATDYIGMSDVANGFAGKITAANLTETPWITLPLRTGYSVAENNPPQYRIIYNLDGTKEIVFRGQYKRDSGAMLAGSDQYPINLTASIRPETTIMGYGATNTGNGARLYCTNVGWLGTIIGSSNATYVEISNMSYQIKN
ncbi:phage tail spike protein [Vagococcus fluvialis]|uniref:phage tail spike protein n=1 Tax=Vagococcus fluvialis TaxID=2738 RepID=UPI003BF32A39